MAQAHWLVPDWPAPANVRAVFSTRAGGVSSAPYDSLNLGDHVGDEAARVVENRRRMGEATGANHVYMKQVHGAAVARLDAATAQAAQPIEADGCFTQDRGYACTIMVADCLPVLLASKDGAVVGAAHAGWRGLAGGVVEATLETMLAATGSTSCLGTADVVAWLGPCIGPEAFEVGDDVREAFVAHDSGATASFKLLREGKWLTDLPRLTRARLKSAGVASIHGNDSSGDWCTVANPSRFFSHRRDRVSGRFAAAVWLA